MVRHESWQPNTYKPPVADTDITISLTVSCSITVTDVV